MKRIEQVRLSVMATLTNIIRELDQINVDVEYWNGIDPQHRPIDIERNRLALDRAKKCLELVTARKNCEREWEEMKQFLA